MRQDQVLLVADADLVEGVFLGDVGDRLHLAVAGVARRFADALQRDRHRGIVGMAVGDDVLVEPFAEAPGIEPGKPHDLVAFRPRDQRRRREIGLDGADVGLGQLSARVSFSAAHSASTWRANSSAPVSCTRILMRALYLLSRRP